VILDLLMPEMPGLQVLQELRQRFPELPVLLSSGYAPDEQVRQALALPRTAFLQKPYTLAQLEQALAHLLRPRE
jgi:Response regulator containing CheY-like receiver, AAA-type ATPase, and DNA-binding domains